MPLLLAVALAGPFAAWLQRLGGLGLILLGLLDNSVIPLPGSMDLALIILSAHHHSYWPYYALMATVGAVIGGYLTYRLAEKGGEETLEKKVGKRRAEKVYRRFKEHGFATVAVGAMLPPPFPIVPFLLAAGALKYPRKHFLAALALGRAARFVLLGYLASRYGQGVMHWLMRYYHPLLYTLIVLSIAGGIAALVYFKWYRPKHQQPQSEGRKVKQMPKPPEAGAKRNGPEGPVTRVASATRLNLVKKRRSSGQLEQPGLRPTKQVLSMNMSLLRSIRLTAFTVLSTLIVAALAGCGGGSSNNPAGSGDAPTATLSASPSSITAGQSATLTWSTTNATSAQIDNGVGSVTVPSGTQTVTPTQTTTYTITAMGSNNQQATAQATVTVNAANAGDINHVVFMLQENRSFDTYFGMLNPYRASNSCNVGEDGNTYTVDGIDDKLSQLHQ